MQSGFTQSYPDGSFVRLSLIKYLDFLDLEQRAHDKCANQLPNGWTRIVLLLLPMASVSQPRMRCVSPSPMPPAPPFTPKLQGHNKGGKRPN